MRLLALGEGAEFELIRQVLEQDARTRGTLDTARAARIITGPGSDCAILAAGRLALSTDASIEDVHFRRSWMTPQQIGYRAATAALSDLAAAAARPIGLLATVAVSPADGPDFALAVMAGVSEAAAACGALLLGGDVSASPGPAIVSLTVAGTPAGDVSRAGARPGDEIWVTGELGGAAVAVRSWLQGDEPPADAVHAFKRPVARIQEALWLQERGLLHAAIDVSDGLAGDAGHLAAASGVHIQMELAAVPLAPVVRAMTLNREQIAELAVSGGEDYELCFAAPAGEMAGQRNAFEQQFALPLTRVGRVATGRGVSWLNLDGSERTRSLAGYTHFRRTGTTAADE